MYSEYSRNALNSGSQTFPFWTQFKLSGEHNEPDNCTDPINEQAKSINGCDVDLLVSQFLVGTVLTDLDLPLAVPGTQPTRCSTNFVLQVPFFITRRVSSLWNSWVQLAFFSQMTSEKLEGIRDWSTFRSIRTRHDARSAVLTEFSNCRISSTVSRLAVLNSWVQAGATTANKTNIKAICGDILQSEQLELERGTCDFSSSRVLLYALLRQHLWCPWAVREYTSDLICQNVYQSIKYPTRECSLDDKILKKNPNWSTNFFQRTCSVQSIYQLNLGHFYIYLWKFVILAARGQTGWIFRAEIDTRGILETVTRNAVCHAR